MPVELRRRRRFLLVLVHAVAIQAITFALRPTLSYAVLDIGVAAALLGLVTAAFAVPALLLALPAGRAIDRLGERRSLILGSIAVVASALMAFGAGSSLWLLLLATVLLGVGHLLSVIGEQALLANNPGTRGSDSLFGMYAFAAALGQTLGPLLLVLPGGSKSTPPLGIVFLACAGLAVVMLGISAFMPSSPVAVVENRSGMFGTAATMLRIPGLAKALITSAIVLASVDLFLTYIPALGHERGLTAAVVGVTLAVRSVFSMVSRFFLGRLVHAFGRRAVMVWSVALSAVALVGMGLPWPSWWLVALAAVFGFAVGTCQPITMSWISELPPSGSRALAMSLRLAFNRLGQTVLPAALGGFAAVTGVAGVIVVTGVMVGIGVWPGAAVRETRNLEEPELPPEA